MAGQSLSNELLRDILDHIEADPEKSIDVDRRAYLSVESFKPPPLPSPGQAEAIANFRLVCKRFSELGIPHQFTQVATRFSKAGFERLRHIAERPHLARAVKKFTYMVPFFYLEGHARIGELISQAGPESRRLNTGKLILKSCQQREIVDSKTDAKALELALSAFKSLQHIQLLRLQDGMDRELLDYLRRNREFADPFVQLEWAAACEHATKTLGVALLKSTSPASRFSGPMMDAQSALALREGPQPSVSFLASRITCLELHFDDPVNLDEKMRRLSNAFGAIFNAANNMQAVHIGFPARSPLSIPLEDIFHDVRWERLRAFGIQGWRLNADEIIALARRHRQTLRGLRLRDVLLKDGSKWQDILQMLRNEMERLDWVSLRRAGYAAHFDYHVAGRVEIEHELPPSDSDDEDEWEAAQPHHEETSSEEEETEEENSLDDDSDVESINTDHGPGANDLSLDPDTPLTATYCTCGQHGFSNDPSDLGDNGRQVSYEQRKMWEQWVIGRCLEHSKSPT